MNIGYYYKDMDAFEIKPYNGKDISKPIENLDLNIILYWINEVYPAIENPNKTRLSGEVKNEFTNEIHHDYKHFKIVNRIHLTEEIPMEQVIENLNTAYGAYLDEQYPQVERLNHSIELQAGTTQDRVDYIKTLQSWLIDCKLDRKKRIQDYIENDIFPSFENFIQTKI